jgi:serralysin
MTTVTFGPDAAQEGTGFINDIENAFLQEGAQTATTTTTITLSADLGESTTVKAVFTGTNVQTGGTVTDLSLSYNDNVNFSISGLNISADAITNAAHEAQTAVTSDEHQQAYNDFAALFAGINWTIDLSSLTVGSLIFGSGGDDHITMSGVTDFLMLDGGNDTDDAGDGDDTIFAANLNYTVKPGVSDVNGGDGIDTFALDYRDDGSGQIIDFFAKGQTVDLQKGSFHVKPDATYNFRSIENLRGSEFNDKLLGNGVANYIDGEEGKDVLTGQGGKDTLMGNLGDDTLMGGGGKDSLDGGNDDDKLDGGIGADELKGNVGADVLTGGVSADHFVYVTDTDSNKQLGFDTITDFKQKQHDKIDISAIELPDPEKDHYKLIGDHKFGHHAGEIQVVEHDEKGKAHDFTMVNIDLLGKGKADMEIELTGLVHLDKGDFIF